MFEFLYNFVNYSWQNKRLWLTVGCCNISPQPVILPRTNWKFWECNIKFDSRNYSWSDFIGTWNKRSYLPLLLLPSFLEIISLYLTLNYINSMVKICEPFFFLNYQKYGSTTEIIHQSPKQNILDSEYFSNSNMSEQLWVLLKVSLWGSKQLQAYFFIPCASSEVHIRTEFSETPNIYFKVLWNPPTGECG